MKFRQFLDTCLQGDEKVLGKLGGLAKKKPEEKKEETPSMTPDLKQDEPKKEPPVEEKKEDTPKEEPPKEEPKEEEEDIKMVKPEKKPEDEEKKKDDVKESFILEGEVHDAEMIAKKYPELEDFISTFDIKLNTATEMWMSDKDKERLFDLAKEGASFKEVGSDHQKDHASTKGWKLLAKHREDGNYEAIMYKEKEVEESLSFMQTLARFQKPLKENPSDREGGNLPMDPSRENAGFKVGQTVYVGKNNKKGMIKKFGGDAVYVSFGFNDTQEFDISEINAEPQ